LRSRSSGSYVVATFSRLRLGGRGNARVAKTLVALPMRKTVLPSTFLVLRGSTCGGCVAVAALKSGADSRSDRKLTDATEYLEEEMRSLKPLC
jgi:hypothetical protein